MPTYKNNPTAVEDIAKTIIDIGKLCENHGVKKVIISGVIVRKLGYMERRRTVLNSLLKELCHTNKYVFIDNDNITREHLANDGVHLEKDGTITLANNMLFALHSLF